MRKHGLFVIYGKEREQSNKWGVIIDTAVIVALITGSFSFATFIFTRYFSNKDKQTEQIYKDDAKDEQLEQEQKKQEEDMKSMQDTVNKLLDLQQVQNNSLAQLTDATRSTLRNDIIQMYNKYTSEEYGFMPIHERENLEHLVTDYYALGGNGVIPGLVEEMQKLPTEKAKF